MKPNWFIGWPVSAGAWWQHVPEPPRGIRRFHPQDLHITLAFLGAVSESDARRAWERLPPPPSFEISLGRVVPMGNPRRYSALSALLDRGRESVEAWMALHRPDVLAHAGAPPARHGIMAHCTLARPQRRTSQAAREAGLRWASELAVSTESLHLGQLALYTWSRDRKHRLFRIVASHEP